MEQNNRHPLESITSSGSMSILEALIPFVEYPLKLPLALLIKFNEINLIINAFRSLDNITRLGLHNTSTDPMEVMCSMVGISPELLKMMSSLTENMNDSNAADILSGLSGNSSPDFSNFANLFQNVSANQEHNDEPSPPVTHTEEEAENSEFSNDFNSDMTQNSSHNTDEDFEFNIQNILAEYDLKQAEHLNQ